MAACAHGAALRSSAQSRLQRAALIPTLCARSIFCLQTLERSYLLRINGRVVERPQHMLMRVAVGIHKDDIESAIQTYHLMSERWFTHASPTLFNSGTPHPQLSSCFLVCMKNDSIEGIYDTLKECATISKSAGEGSFALASLRPALSPACPPHERTAPDYKGDAGVPVPLVCFDVCMWVCRWHWSVHPLHPRYGQLHPRHQRYLQRHRAHVARFQ